MKTADGTATGRAPQDGQFSAWLVETGRALREHGLAPGLDDYDHDLIELLQEAVEAGLIKEGTPAHGITVSVAHHGYNSLTDDQKNAYDKHAAPHLEKIGQQREVQRRIQGIRD